MATTASFHFPATDQRWHLSEHTTVIGRDVGCEMAIVIDAVSRRHASVQRSGHGWVVCDLESSNGTWLNGERLGNEAYPLRDGDQLVLAGTVTLHFSDPQATPMAPAIGRLTGVWLDPETNAVWVDAQQVEPPLSGRQQALLALLSENIGEIVTREQIVDHVWADVAAEGVSAEALDALVKRLRSRIRPLQMNGECIEVIRGRGIRLLDPRANGR